MEPFMYFDTILGGVGGQGIMVIGSLLAQAAFLENRQVTYLPAYGVEKRGGYADCTVVISSEEIDSPVVGSPESLIALSQSALAKYAPRMKAGGVLLLNSSLIDPQELDRTDVELLAVPALEMAKSLGNDRLANMVAIGAFAARTRAVRLDSLISGLSRVLGPKYHRLLPANAEAIRRGAAFADGRLD
jgi:2-oxoglutarate ferredoxin oxidoreductase subunit gamma